jgi:hypothetical protein
MAERLSRKVLHDLVWSEPLKTLATRFGISDVALKKRCARAGIPTPGLGYWARKAAGKPTFQPAFALRPPGMDDEILVGGGGDDHHPLHNQEELLGPLPPPPEFPEPIETVRVELLKLSVTSLFHVTYRRGVPPSSASSKRSTPHLNAVDCAS